MNSLSPEVPSSPESWRGPAKLAAGCLVILALLFGGLCWMASYSEHGAVYETKLLDGGSVSLRVTAYPEKIVGPGLPGAYFVFEGRPKDVQAWSRIFEFRHDDAIPIRERCAGFSGDNVAYVYLGWVVGVTSDGGRTWSVWDASRDSEGYRTIEECNYRWIREVGINADGSGTMNVDPIRWTEVTELRTTDFGRNWAP